MMNDQKHILHIMVYPGSQDKGLWIDVFDLWVK